MHLVVQNIDTMNIGLSLNPSKDLSMHTCAYNNNYYIHEIVGANYNNTIS